MFKINEKYVVSLNNKDKGILTVLAILNKRNYNVRRRLHQTKRVYLVMNNNI